METTQPAGGRPTLMMRFFLGETFSSALTLSGVRRNLSERRDDNFSKRVTKGKKGKHEISGQPRAPRREGDGRDRGRVARRRARARGGGANGRSRAFRARGRGVRRENARRGNPRARGAIHEPAGARCRQARGDDGGKTVVLDGWVGGGRDGDGGGRDARLATATGDEGVQKASRARSQRTRYSGTLERRVRHPGFAARRSSFDS